MRARPIRSRIYIPVRKLGVVLEDWKYVAVIALSSYSVAFFLNITVYHIPLEYVTGFGGLIGSITFFNWARIGRPPGWIYYRIRGVFTSYAQRGVLPAISATEESEWCCRKNETKA